MYVCRRSSTTRKPWRRRRLSADANVDLGGRSWNSWAGGNEVGLGDAVAGGEGRGGEGDGGRLGGRSALKSNTP